MNMLQFDSDPETKVMQDTTDSGLAETSSEERVIRDITPPSPEGYSTNGFAAAAPEEAEEAAPAPAPSPSSEGFFSTSPHPANTAPTESVDTTDGGTASGPAIDQDAFLRILAEHHRWVETQGKEGRRANLRSQELTHLDLSNLNLAECSFRGANLTGVSLAYSDLHSADFSEANLMQANLTGCDLHATNLVRTNLSYSQNSQADFTGANMTQMVADSASFQNAKLNHAIVRETSMMEADFTHASLNETNLRNSNLSDAVFTDADLTNADFRDANCERAHFKGANLTGVNFKGANLSSVEMDKADFSQAQDVSKTYQTESFNLEKAKLAEDQEALKRAQADLAAREKLLADGKNQLEHDRLEFTEKVEQVGILALRAKKPARWFTISMVIWLAISLGYGALVYSLLADVDLKKVKIVEFSIATGIMFFLFMTFFVSFLKAIQVQSIIKRLVATGLDQRAFEGAKINSIPNKTAKEPKVFQTVSTVSRGSIQAATTLKQKNVASGAAASADTKAKPGGGFGKKK